MLQKLKLSIPLPLAVLIALISFLIGMSFGDVLPNFGNRLNPTPIPQMNVIHMIQTGFAQREIFRQDKEYNNCVGTETLEVFIHLSMGLSSKCVNLNLRNT